MPQQAARCCNSRGGPLAGDSAVGYLAGNVDRQGRKVDSVHDGRNTIDPGESPVVTELELVEDAASKGGLQGQDTILRNGTDEGAAACDTFRLIVVPLIAKVSCVERIAIVNLVIEPDPARIFIHVDAGLELRDVEVGIGGRVGEYDRVGSAKCVQQGRYGRNGAGAR